jgi:hypothetical protein
MEKSVSSSRKKRLQQKNPIRRTLLERLKE